MERKDWLYVALHLILIIMLLVAFGDLWAMEERLEKKEAREQAFRECEFIKEAKELVDDPAFYEVASPDTIKFYEKYAQLYPLIEEPYRKASDSTEEVAMITFGVNLEGPEGYAHHLAGRLFGWK